MESLFKKMIVPSILSSVILLVLGVVIYINPEDTLKITSIVIGSIVILFGIIGIFQYVVNREKDSFKFNILYVTTTIILGVIMIWKYKAIVSIIPIILGIWICFDSFIKFRMSLGIKNLGIKNYRYPLVMSILSFIIGVFLLFNPYISSLIIMKISAIGIAFYAIIDIVQNFAISKYLN